MRKKIVLTFLIVLITVIAITSCVLATNTDNVADSEQENEVTIIEENEEEVIEEENSETALEEVINSDIFGMNEIIERSNEIVAGNVYLCGNNVSIENEYIEGDVFICANTVKIGDGTQINGNAYICGSNIAINGQIARALFIAGKDISFGENALVMYNVALVADHATVNGTFGRNFNATITNFEILEGARILGTLNYTSDTEATINDGADITDINFSKHVEEEESTLEIVCDYVLDFAKYFVLTMVVLIILMKVSFKFVNECKKCFGITSFGAGILTLLLVPIIAVLFIILQVTSTLAWLMIAILVTSLILAMAVTNIAIGAWIADKKPNIKLPMATALATIITWIILQIPILGSLIAFILLTTGLGILVRYGFVRSK